MIALGLALLAASIWAYLLLARGQFWRSRLELAPTSPDAGPLVSIIVPARDEADTIAVCLRSLLAQTYLGGVEVILVDDQSSDATGVIARAVEDPRLRVLAGQPKPPGWSGKMWAVRQGLAAAHGPLVLLTDADIVHAPNHLATLVAGIAARDLVSEMVRMRRQTWSETLLIPAFVYFFQMLYPFRWVADPDRRDAAAAGGTVLVRAEALRLAGGIEAIRGALIDDVALATLIKRAGFRIWLGHTNLARSLRAYPAAADVWRMIKRTAYVQLRHSPSVLALCVVGMVITFLLAPGLVVLANGAARAIGLLTWFGAAATLLPTLRRYRASPLVSLALPAIAAFYLGATLASAIDAWCGRGAVWKGRAYAAADLP